MQELTSPKEMREWSRAERARGRRIGFVPTMGFLHEGHLRLVDRAKQRADRVAMSIFVNPLQFGPTEDLAQYPRDLARDRTLAAERGVDCLFVPDTAAMYPTEPLVRVSPGPMADALEGAARRAALALSRALRAVEQAWRGGEADPGPLARRGLEVLRAPGVAPEYLALVDEQMRPVARVDARTAVLVAAKVGKTRLIDNVVLGEGVASDISVRALA